MNCHHCHSPMHIDHHGLAFHGRAGRVNHLADGRHQAEATVYDRLLAIEADKRESRRRIWRDVLLAALTAVALGALFFGLFIITL